STLTSRSTCCGSPPASGSRWSRGPRSGPVTAWRSRRSMTSEARSADRCKASISTPGNLPSVETEPSAIAELRELVTKISDLHHATGVLAWDQETYMPAGGLEARARQLSTLSRLAHEMFIAEATGDLVSRAEAATAGEPFES